MEKRKAIAMAGSATAIAAAGVVALGANLGLFGLTDQDSKVGNFPAVDRVVETQPTTSSTDVPATTPDVIPTVPTFDDSAPTVDDDELDDDELEDEFEHEDEDGEEEDD